MANSQLYKFLDAKYADAMVQRGELLFGNLTRFKQMEHGVRGDVMEGCHVDNPEQDVTLNNLTTGRSFKGRFSMRTSVNDEKIFVFCVSRAFDKSLYGIFGTDSCVEISDILEFSRRVSRAIRQLNFIDKAGLLHGPVSYFRPNENSVLDISDGKNIPFLKHVDFKPQNEHRFVFARQGAFKTVKRIIIDQDWSTEPDHLKGKARKLLLTVGSLTDICRVHPRA